MNSNPILIGLLIWRKLILLSVIALILTAIPTFLYIHEAAKSLELELAEKRGLLDIRQILKPIRLTQQHRGLSGLVLAGVASAKEQREAKQKEADLAYAEAQQMIKALDNKAIQQVWAKSDQDWLTLRDQVSSGRISMPQSYQAHSALVSKLLVINELIGDYYGLNLDPSVDTYQLMQAMIYIQPNLTEAMAELRGKGASLLAMEDATQESKMVVIEIIARTREQIFQIENAFGKAALNNPEIQGKLGAAIKNAKGLAITAIQLANEKIVKVDSLDYSPVEYFAIMTKAIDAQSQLNTEVLQELDHILGQRISEFYQIRWWMTGTMSLLILVAGLFARAIVRSVSIPLAERTLDLARTLAERISGERRLNTLVETITDCIIVIDKKGKIDSANTAVQTMFGYMPEEIIGRNIHLLMPTPYAEEHDGHLQNYITTGRKKIIGIGREVICKRKDGSTFPATLSVGEMEINGERMFTGLLHDITERRLHEEALAAARDKAEASAKSKSVFLSNMSHEIRTPLNGVIGMVELMLDDELSASQRHRAGIISRSARLLRNVLTDILDFSKIEAGKLDVEHIDFNLRELLHDLGQLFSILAAEKGLSFANDVEPSVPEWVNGDPVRLKQILNNLLANAVKFTDHGIVGLKVCMVESSDGSITLRFEVSDTGIGISAEFLGKIFSAFEQADASTSRRYGGTGLGLAISKQLTELMGGRIDVAANENGGSRFSVLLCMGVANPVPQPATQPARHKRANVACRLLLAEDDPVSQLVAIGTLQKLGYDDITLAANGQEALEKWAQGRFDAILMDVQMPVMNGYQTTAILRKQACALPIIAMTANALRGDREKCLAAGMNDYVSKPISKDILATVLARWTMPDATSEAQAQTVHAEGVKSAGSDALVPQPLAALTFGRLLLLDLFENDEKLMSAVLAVALEKMPIAIANLEAAFDDGKNDEAERYAHSLKGSAANVGALALSAIALQVECLAPDGDRVALGTLMEMLKDEFASFRAAVSDVGCAPGDCPDAKET